MKNYFIAICTAALCTLLVACGGGSSDSKAPSTNTGGGSTPTTPTISVSFQNTTTQTNVDTIVAEVTVSDTPESVTFENTDQIQQAFIVVDGQKTEFTGNTVNVTAKTFQLMLNHNQAETINIGVKTVKVGGTDYHPEQYQDVTFEKNASINASVSIHLTTSRSQRIHTNGYGQMTVGSDVNDVHMDNLEISFFQNQDDGSYVLYDTVSNVMMDDNYNASFELPAGLYIIKAKGSHQVNDDIVNFEGTYKAEAIANAAIGLTFVVHPINLTTDMMDRMKTYNNNYVTGEMKNITMYEILPHLSCILFYEEMDNIISPSTRLELNANLVCQEDGEYQGATLESNLPVRAEISFPGNTDTMTYDVYGEAIELQTANLSRGNNTFTITLDNISYSDQNLVFSIKGMEVYVANAAYSTMADISYNIRITE